jgi:hypothetical protein
MRQFHSTKSNFIYYPDKNLDSYDSFLKGLSHQFELAKSGMVGNSKNWRRTSERF